MNLEEQARYRLIGGKVYKLVGTCNPNVCEAWCCRYIVARVPKNNPDDAAYFSAHGIDVMPAGKEIVLKIPSKCFHLRFDNMCAIYGERFSVCRKYARKKLDVFQSSKCGLQWVEVFGREAQVAISRKIKSE